MLNYRKRPRQTGISDPLAGQFGCRPGPSGAAGYSGLMPVGGFGQQHRNYPTSGRGAATFNRNTSNNAYSDPPVGRGYQGVVQRSNVPSTSGTYQQGVRRNTAQNRSIPSGSGQPSTQTYNTMPQNIRNSAHSFKQGCPYNEGNSTSGYGRGRGVHQNNWNYGNQQYNSSNVMGNSTRATSYEQTVVTTRNSQQQQQRNNWPNPANQRMQSYNIYQYNNRGVTHNEAEDIADEWNNSFTESTSMSGQSTNKVNKNVVKPSNADKTALSELKKSLHLLTVDIAGLKRWNKFKDSVQIMFEVFGQLDSATARGTSDSKEFLIRDEKKNEVTCVFYEIDRQLSKMTRGQWYRLVGTYDGTKETFMCLSIRPLKPAERNLVYPLTKKSTEIMCKLTRNMRES
ncbi:spermatogenesis-associated protein 22-like isoform X2 [Mercenaria mercenaria]|nr:spermatogenesis-associated protein 22-like isoform X2 [Mercenaria mercenaria]XP_053375991.1 spermatogenesis-associated protein 22-like isoform X2 [Mercenaria mercenaria]